MRFVGDLALKTSLIIFFYYLISVLVAAAK